MVTEDPLSPFVEWSRKVRDALGDDDADFENIEFCKQAELYGEGLSPADAAARILAKREDTEKAAERARERDELAERLFVSAWHQERLSVGDGALALQAFDAAEAFLAERGRRRS